jgi:dipeptidyl aminopeptidase/acylaminoacyl peptidase
MIRRMVLRAALGGALLMLIPPLHAQKLPAQPATADDLASNLAAPLASNLAGARDTARFAWVEYAAGVRNIQVATPGTPARQVTDYREDDGQELYDLAFSNDGARLAYVRGGDPEYPDGSIPNTASATVAPKQQVFVMPAAGGRATLVGEGHSPVFAPDGNRLAFTRKGAIWLWSRTGARKIATAGSEITDLQWSPDGTRLLFTDNRGDHSFVALLDVATTKLRYLDPGLGYSVEPIFSPDGARIAFIRFVDPPSTAKPGDGPYWSVRIADAATGASRIAWAAPAGAGGQYAGTRGRNLYWSADGALIFPWERSGWMHVYAVDASGSARELTPGAFEVESFTLGADRRSIVYAANAGDLDSRRLWRVPVAGGAPEKLTKGNDFEQIPVLGGDQLAAIATDATHPAHVVLVAGGAPLGHAVAIPGFTAPEIVVFKAADGVEVHGQLFHGSGPGPHPALIHVHGGPRRQMLPGFHTSLYYSNAYILNQHFAAEGYDVLSVNYRSGTGYGHDFREAPEIARAGAAEYRDVLAGGRWLAARPDVDPARIGIWGGSWGGYLTALALARDSALFAAGVDFHGVHAMVRPVEKTLSPDQEAAAHQLQWQSSPMGAIEHWRSPVLLIHGDDDMNVDFYQSLLLARELTARRVPFRELVFPNERHDFFRHSDWLKSYQAADAFLDLTLMKKQPLP